MPTRADLDPIDFRYALGYVVLVDVERHPLRFRFRLYGSGLVNYFGDGDYTGKYADELLPADYAPFVVEAYTAAVEQVSAAGDSEPSAILLSNRDGQPVTSAAQALEYLVAQLTRPVRWDLCTETLRAREVTAIVEFPPAGTLAGIAKRELRGTPTHAVKSPADLDGLPEF